MEKKIKINARYLTKEYDFSKKKSDKLKNFFSFKRNTQATFWALKGCSFKVYEGESVGIIGTNGSGKSTLSNILSGVMPPTSGYLEINGETSIISIGSGLKLPLTGLENIRLKSLMMGLTNEQIDAIIEDIVNFSELGAFIHQPVKTYSSGMRSRLGFAIAVHQNPDILIIDEALAVGDDAFYQKCLNQMLTFKEQGKTIFFVSHSLAQVEKLCDQTIWMHYGEIKHFGPTQEVVKAYKEYNHSLKGVSKEEHEAYKAQHFELQKSFSLEQLKNETIDLLDLKSYSRKQTKEIQKDMKMIPIGQKMPISTKIFLSFTGLILFLLCCFSLEPQFFSNIQYFSYPIDSKANQSIAQSVVFESTVELTIESTSTDNQLPIVEETNIFEKTDDNTVETMTEATPQIYIVQEGDNLEMLAMRYGTTIEELINTNQLASSELDIGQELVISME